ncbi:MAG: glycogen debranching protein GlgX [Candidatus Riflebacteria bacterium]|nr:glycogen debranching protein GlgX [Candidatus Riflebacteria bacterium]
MARRRFETAPGRPHPLGASYDREGKGTNFAVFSQHATEVEVLLFDEHDSPEPVQVLRLDPRVNRTFYFWHVYVKDALPGMHYAFRVDGPEAPEKGHRFCPAKLLIDPYARGNTNTLWRRPDACGTEDNLRTSLRSVIIDQADYDWEGDQPLRRPMSETVIYEMHVRGFTRDPSSGVKHPGTFAGVVEKIPYLKELGVTAVELMPVFEFDDTEVLRDGPDGKPLVNYWGYSTVGFFSPHRAFCVTANEGTHLREFRDMVKALHRAGIEVLLDVVFNHTNEGNHQGPTISFKGLDNSIYYHLVADQPEYYMDYSGCGNTLNCNHPIVEKLIVECLKFWVCEMHVDGFRFDEGSILSRGQDGAPMEYPPVLWHIETSEVLADTKVIAEAWDAAGLYQIGYFPGYRWAEWNGRFRDDVRKFVKGDPGVAGAVASRLAGSSDLYEASGHLPVNSVNFVTCHDGFTMNDLVSYNEKHNWANGEENRDGINDNQSWNCGIEGETDDESVERLRNRQVKNFAAILLLSQGVPMLCAGDEFRRTQGGNNNAYCHDDPLSWLDWSLLKKHPDVYRFFSRMVGFRRRHPIIHRSRFFSGELNSRGLKDIEWHGTQLGKPDFEDAQSRVLAFTMGGFGDDPDLHVLMNMHWEPLEFELPVVPGRTWYRVVDTSLASPQDLAEPGREARCQQRVYRADARSIVALISR